MEEISGNSDAWWRSAAAGLDRCNSPQSGMGGATKASRMIGELHWRQKSRETEEDVFEVISWGVFYWIGGMSQMYNGLKNQKMVV